MHSLIKNKKFILITTFLLLLTFLLFVFSILGNISRIGYLSDLQEIEDSNTLSSDDNKLFQYNFKFKTQSNIFKNSDLYALNIDFNSSTNQNIKYIKTDKYGSAFGTLWSDTILSTETYYYSYTLKIKNKIILLYILIVIAYIVSLFISIISFKISNKDYIAKSNLTLIGESELGNIYRAEINIKKNYFFNFYNTSFSVYDTNIKPGFLMKITNKPLSSWYSSDIYYSSNGSFIIDNKVTNINAYNYDIQIPTFVGDRYKITMIAKKIPERGLIFTSKEITNDITFNYKLVLHKIYYYIIPFGIIFLILLYKPIISRFLRDTNGISYTLFSSILLVNALYKHPKFSMINISDDVSDAIPLIRLRFLIVIIMMFVVPIFLLTLL